MWITWEQMVDPHSFALINAFVDVLDLDSFGFDNSKLNKEGHPPFHPSILLILYSYEYGLRSCWKLEHAAKVNTPTQFIHNLTKGLLALILRRMMKS